MLVGRLLAPTELPVGGPSQARPAELRRRGEGPSHSKPVLTAVSGRRPPLYDSPVPDQLGHTGPQLPSSAGFSCSHPVRQGGSLFWPLDQHTT